MDLTFEPREGFLLATVAGRKSLHEAIESSKKALDCADELGFDRILIDCSAVEGKLSDLEAYELGRTMAEYSRSRCKNPPHVATLGKQPTINGFVAQVAWNRGLNAKTFAELQPALDWLNRFGSNASGS